MKPNHQPEHMARMYRAANGTRLRVFTEREQQFIRTAYPDWRTWSLEAMANELRCRTSVLKRAARDLGLPPRRQDTPSRNKKASQLVAKRKNNKAARYEPDPDGERSSPEPTQTLYACPGCGMRSASPMGHAQCQRQEAA
jgi:hypothetical protein